MNGKEAMQEEFFHTFNALLDKGSQIIVSADRAPNKLSRIQERIKSRFSGGLVVDIQKPDYQLRKEIVAKKADELTSLYSDQKKISHEKFFFDLNIMRSIRLLFWLRSLSLVDNQVFVYPQPNLLKILILFFLEF